MTEPNQNSACTKRRMNVQSPRCSQEGTLPKKSGCAKRVACEVEERRMKPNVELIDPVPDAEWEIWYEDTFDRECPRQVEIAGLGLAKGLVELWARHLFETVQVDGQEGFSRFNLWWKQNGQSVEIVGAWKGLTRLRGWVFGDKRRAQEGYVRDGDADLLAELAVAHADLILAGRTSEVILEAACTSGSLKDFETRLASHD
jgi:hypothetical protein